MRRFLLVLAILLLSSVSSVAYAQMPQTLGGDFHIIPDASELDPSCPEGAPLSFGAIMAVAQSALGIAISFGVLICIVIMAWAGFILVLSPFNAEGKSKARTMLTNAGIGLLIVLSSWLIVDFVMKTLYSGPDGTKGKFGPWNSILGGGSACVVESENIRTLFSGRITAEDIAMSEGWENDTPVPSGGTGANCPAAAESAMVAFPSVATTGGTKKATPTTVSNFMKMREAALKDGVDLKVTSAYRSEADQVAIWNKLCGSGTCGSVKAAKPCSKGGNGSNHNSGEAVDINVGCRNGQSGCNTKTYNWLKANGSKWGFRNNLPSDPLHWSPSGR